MSLTLVTNPIGSAAKKMFAGLKPIEFIFKREDLVITSVVSGTGGIKINHAGDLTSYLSAGDSIYVYSVGTNYTYSATGIIITIVAGEITIDIPYVETGTGGYINYYKNYYVELQCVRDALPDVNLLPFSLQADGNAAGNISIDVSIINDLNMQRGILITEYLATSKQEFEVKYRQVYTGSAGSFILIDNKLCVVLYSSDAPEEEVVLNHFDLPKLYLGYPAGLAMAHLGGTVGTTIELKYNELDINKNIIETTGTLGILTAALNGFLMWKWPVNASVLSATKYIEFNFKASGIFDFKSPDFAYPDFITQ
jgi:hypothetical protein